MTAIATPEPEAPSTRPDGARMVRDVVDVDLTDPRAFVGGPPHDAFDELRRHGGVAWHDERPAALVGDGVLVRVVDSPGFWTVTAYDLVREVLKDQRRFSSHLGTAFMPTMAPESLVMFRQMMINMDPPEHLRLRRILQPVFTPKAIEQLRGSIVTNTVELMDALDGRDTCDLVTDVSAEMPLRVLADLLGMPREDRHLIFEWSNGLLGFDSPGGPEPGAGSIDAVTGLMGYGRKMAEDRRAHPLDDIVSRIVNAEADGECLNDTEIEMFWLLLVIAGNETTRNALSGSVVALDEQDQWTWLAEHPESLPTAVDELLRFVSPVQHFRRTATEDTALGDQQIRAGDKVVVWLGAANRDPSVFADPHRLDLQRDPNQHVAFGIGNHFCLGAHLARLEMYEVLGHLLRRAPRLTVDGPVAHVASNFINGINHLPVRLGS